MREVNVKDIRIAVGQAIIKANTELPDDIVIAIKNAIKKESFLRARNLLDIILENAEIAQLETMALCQDTGMIVVEVELGQEVHLIGGELEKAINQGVRDGYEKGFFRKSVVNCPFERINTGDNTPAIIYINLVAGDCLKFSILPKGAGSENMGRVAMLKPSQGLEGVKDFVIQVVKEAGANPCPPVIVGVGVGGNMEKAAFLSKKALLRKLDCSNSDPAIEALEKDLLININRLGIGPQGLGGDTTALAVNIETYPTHIASLPVAVNLGCHCTRRVMVEV